MKEVKGVVLKSSCIERFAHVTDRLRKLAASDAERIVIAIDGKCASGKTTLGYYLQQEFDANLFHMDDFFLQKEQRTPKRLAEVGGNVDYERFQTEVLEPLLAGNAVKYRPFHCKTLQIGEGVEILPKRGNIIEGSYSQHTYFGDIYDLKVFMEIEPEKQLENIRERNGEEQLEVFKQRWIPKEEAYFEVFGIKEKSDIVVEWKK
ncbi:MAG: hypothetical protein IJ274_03245 [Lachnospiraceae bacterium]|nr:hypothetical protein [Lachnospiraceae bacterium]